MKGLKNLLKVTHLSNDRARIRAWSSLIPKPKFLIPSTNLPSRKHSPGNQILTL